jgi:hypothetical protein
MSVLSDECDECETSAHLECGVMHARTLAYDTHTHTHTRTHAHTHTHTHIHTHTHTLKRDSACQAMTPSDRTRITAALDAHDTAVLATFSVASMMPGM